MTRWKHQDSPVRPGSVRSPLASSITIALSAFPEAGARGGSPLSEASILLRLPSLGGGRLSAREGFTVSVLPSHEEDPTFRPWRRLRQCGARTEPRLVERRDGKDV